MTAPGPTTPALVGVDIGGTKTHVMITSGEPENERVDEFIVSSSWRPALGDAPADAQGLHDLLVSLGGERLLGVPLAVGAHGCDSTAQCLDLERELRAYVMGPVLVVNDSELMGPAMGGAPAIGVVVGTGSIATARNAQGELLTAGGWGWLLGDEGSAPALVRDAARVILASLDGGERLDPLGRRMLAAFGAKDGPEFALAVSTAVSADGWGRHAPEIFTAADEGSQLAITLIDRAADELARSVFRLRARGADSDVVVAGGAVVQRQGRLQEALRSAIARELPTMTLHILDRPPVTGAIALARDLTANHSSLSR